MRYAAAKAFIPAPREEQFCDFLDKTAAKNNGGL